MAERIVVCFRASAERTDSASCAVYVERARALLGRAQALGGALCSWSGRSFSVSFVVEDIEDAIELLVAPEARAAVAGYSVAISSGEFCPLSERRGEVELGSGRVLERALALSRLANSDEILVDVEVDAAHRGDLLTRGQRSSDDGRQALHGLLLDIDQPWRSQAERSVERLAAPALEGRGRIVSTLRPAAGTLATLHAEAGSGGSCVLAAVAIDAAPARTLVVEPVGWGLEPLGALRRAFARDISRFGQPPLDSQSIDTLTRLLSGQGSDSASVASLLEAWLGSNGPNREGLLLVDDAYALDTATLDTIAEAVLGASRPFGSVVRLDQTTPLPAQLAPLPPGPELELGLLPEELCAQIADAWVGGRMSPKVRTIVARRCAGSAVGLREVLALGLSSGELSWTDAGVHLRGDLIEENAPAPAKEWVSRRLRFLPAVPRSVLFAIALLGGQASTDLVEALVKTSGDFPIDIGREIQLLTRTLWLSQTEPGWLSLLSRTHRAAIYDSVPVARRVAWHRAASLLIESREGKLARAEAARHAELADDITRAARLFSEAAFAASRVHLTEPAEYLRAGAEALQAAAKEANGDGMSIAPDWREFGDYKSTLPGQSLAMQLAAKNRQGTARSSFPPVELPFGDSINARPRTTPIESKKQVKERSGVFSDRDSSGDSAKQLGAIPPPPRVPSGMIQAVRVPVREEISRLEIPVEPQVSQALQSSSLPSIPPAANAPPTPQVLRVDEIATTLPIVERDALLAGDAEAINNWMRNEVPTGIRERMGPRIQAIIALAHGEKGEALSSLREACKPNANLTTIEQSRNHLAYAIALAQTHKPLDALVEALEALARSREAADSVGEKACLVFLQKLYAGVGQAEAGELWSHARTIGVHSRK